MSTAGYEPLLTTEQAAELCSVAPRTLVVWRSEGRDGPPFVRVGRRAVRYRPRDIAAWLEAGVRTSTSDPGPTVQTDEPMQPRTRRTARRRRRS